MILWRYPTQALLDDVEYSAEIEAEEPGVWVLVVRDPDNIPRAIAIITGDDRSDAQTLLTLWGLD